MSLKWEEIDPASDRLYEAFRLDILCGYERTFTAEDTIPLLRRIESDREMIEAQNERVAAMEEVLDIHRTETDEYRDRIQRTNNEMAMVDATIKAQAAEIERFKNMPFSSPCRECRKSSVPEKGKDGNWWHMLGEPIACEIGWYWEAMNV